MSETTARLIDRNRLSDRLANLKGRYGGFDGAPLIDAMVQREFKGGIALVSSFGTEAAVLLALAAEVDPSLPVIFLDTGKHFGETLRYRDQLSARLGLTDVRSVQPDPEEIAAADPDGMLWHGNANACCHIRKVLPLRRALDGFDAWITGRKQYQGGLRTTLPTIESDGTRIKINPLANWSAARIEAAFEARDLPRHPLEADGFLSIGCMTCTDRVPPNMVTDAAGRRTGRWSGSSKSECGIHLAPAATAAN